MRFAPARPLPTETGVVVAAVVGLAAAALAWPPGVLAAAALGRRRVLYLLVAVLAFAWGSERVSALDRRVLRPGPFRGGLVVTGRPNAGRATARVPAAGEDVVLVAPAGGELVQGALVTAAGTLRPLDSAVRGYYATQGAHLELRATSLTVTGRRGGVWGAVDRVHGGAVAALGAGGAPPPPRALVAGIALGETAALGRDDRDRLQRSGLYHLVAVSGQNVALVVAFTLVCLGLAGIVGAPARACAIVLTLVYVLVTGAGASILRAGVAGMLVSVAWLASRPPPRWHLLACGAAVVLAPDPLELFDPGFQLSFAAVAAIFGVAPRLERRLGQAAAVSVACTLVTAPIVWWHFGRVSWWSVPANLLAMPAVAPILWLALAGALAGAVWHPLAAPLLTLADVLAGYVLVLARAFS